jgi:hypothetical protein
MTEPNENHRHADDLTDRLLDKKEKLHYFLVTASAAVIVFTFNDLNAPKGRLQEARSLVVVGWVFLLVAMFASLLLIFLRQRQYDRFIQKLYEGVSPQLDHEIKLGLKRVIVAEVAALSLLPAGMATLAIGYFQAVTAATK